MVKKFECWNCRKTFEADDSTFVSCPYCHSDNVEYVTRPISGWIIVVSILLIVAICLGFFVDFSGKKEMGESEEDSVVDIFDDKTNYLGEISSSPAPSSLPILEVGDLSFENDGYSFVASLLNPPLSKHIFRVKDKYEDKIVAQSHNGHFSSVPCSNADGGLYIVEVADNNSDSVFVSEEKFGFIPQQRVQQRMSLEELQTMIDARDNSLMGAGKNSCLSPNYKLVFNGLPTDAVNIPKVLGEVFDKVDNQMWESIKVTEVEYDDMNRICVIRMDVQISDEDF